MVPGGFFQPETVGWGRPRVANPLAVDAAEALDLVFFALFGCVALGDSRGAAVLPRHGRRAVAAALAATSGVGATVVWLVAILVADGVSEGTVVVLTVGGFALIPVAIGVAVLR